MSLKLSEDEKWIITGSKDNTIRMTRNFLNLTDVTVSSTFFILSRTYNPSFSILASNFNDAKEGNLFMNKMVAYLLTDFILKKEVTRACELIRAYPNLAIMPYGINNFHIASSTEANDAAYIQQCIDSKIRFTADMSAQTPLHYLLNSGLKDFQRLDVMLGKSEILFSNNEEGMDRLISRFEDVFLKALTLNNSNVANFLDTCVVPVEPSIASLIPSFGRIKHRCGIYARLSNSSEPSPDLIKDICAQIDEEGTSNIVLYHFRIPLNLVPYSKQLMELMKKLPMLDCDDIFQTNAIKFLIEYSWHCSLRYIQFNSLIYTISILIFSVYAGRMHTNLAMEVIDFSICSYFMLNEINQLSFDWSSYVKDFWNYNDLPAYLLRILTYLLIWTGCSHTVRSWMIAFALLFGYLKWISSLRLFDSTSKQH